MYGGQAVDVPKVYVQHTIVSTLCSSSIVRVQHQRNDTVVGCRM